MKDRKKKEDSKEKPPKKSIQFEKPILESFQEIINMKGKRLSYTLFSKNSKNIIKSKIQTYKLLNSIQKGLIIHHDSITSTYNDMIMESLIYNKNCHIVSIFKDFMIVDYIDEFLKRIYRLRESSERIPKIANYYKNYLKFFCNPVFRNFKINNIIQSYGDYKAELYYNKNYGHKRKKEKTHKTNEDALFLFNTNIRQNIDRNSLTKTTIKIDNSTDYNRNNFIQESFLNFNDSVTTMKSVNSIRSPEESLINILNNLDKGKGGYTSNGIKGFSNNLKNVNTLCKSNTYRKKSDKSSNQEIIQEIAKISSKSPNLKKSGEIKSIKLSKSNTNFFSLKNSNPGHTKNSASVHEKQVILTGGSYNTPILGTSRFSTKLHYNDELNLNKIKKKSEMKSSSINSGNIKLSMKKNNLHDQEKPSYNSELKNTPNPINDIMKITLSLCVDKSSRNRPLSNQLTNINSNINHMGTYNVLETERKTTIINKVDNINNFNININNPIIDNYQTTLNIPYNISKLNSPNYKNELNNLLEKNKILSRNRNPSLYKISTYKNDEEIKKLNLAKESQDLKFFNTYNGNNLLI